MTSRLALIAIVGAVVAGCAPSLATMEPARIVPAGHLQVTTSVDVTDTSGGIADVLDEVEAMANRRGRMTPEEIRTAASATSIVLVQPPAIGYQVSAAYGLSKRFEIGARASLNAVRGWGRWQFLRVSPGVYGALGFGVSGYLYGFPVEQFVDEIHVDGFSRFDIDVPLSLGYSNRWLHLWGGPKLVFSTYDADFTVCTRKRSGDCVESAEVGLGGTAAYLAGQVGLALGYKSVWIAAELTIARVGADGDMNVRANDREEEVAFDQEGMVVSPSVGLIIWF